MRKTRILTRDSARIDPIDRWIKDFSFHEFEDDCLHSRFFLPILSMKSHFQTLLGCANESRSEGKQEIQGLRCLNSLISQNTPE